MCANTDRDLCRVLHPDHSHNPFYPVSLNLLSIGIVIFFSYSIVKPFFDTPYISKLN